jgi:hypothetical protein|tara:strand:- start:270 stop:410 length:141 start_codon:yes stop_codon:yes gene_type:complete
MIKIGINVFGRLILRPFLENYKNKIYVLKEQSKSEMQSGIKNIKYA